MKEVRIDVVRRRWLKKGKKKEEKRKKKVKFMRRKQASRGEEVSQERLIDYGP